MRKIALIILDGWGHRQESSSNAIVAARTPRLTALREHYPFTTLGACGLDVGLPPGQMGNSEVGHLNLGAGRVVYQDYTRISLAIEDGTFYQNVALLGACRAASETGGALHLFGLLSDGGVHSHQEHLYALLELAKRQGLQRVFVHAFLDGRDTPPQSGLAYVSALEDFMGSRGVGRIATVCGRFYAMDRDTRWDRVEKAFRALCCGEGIKVGTGREALEGAYSEGQTDEFVVPRVIAGPDGEALGRVANGDSVIFFNFRADRARELTRAFMQPDFSAFDVSGRPILASYLTFTQYDDDFDLPMAFPPARLTNLFGEVVSGALVPQLRIAETEKYAHVTFFFNGGEELAFPGEERVLIPSPRDVATYDRKPEMSAHGVADRLVEEIRSGRFGAIVANFANLDMVGHTGIMEATVRAVETVDECVGMVVDALRREGYGTIVTADHGNAEEMRDPDTGQPHTAHSTNRVPCILVDDERRGARLREGGILADVAPTLLELADLPQPVEMTGRSLLRT